MNHYIKIIVCLTFLIITSIAYGFSSGPVPGRTGAPGELTCVDCHDSFELNRGPGRVEILDLPKNYQAGQRIKVRVNVRQNNQKRWGFQLTALDKQEQAVGQFVITDPANTQIITSDNRVYVEHTNQGSMATTPGGRDWTFEWVAPDIDRGPVVFYASGNAADGLGNSEGDFIYTTAFEIGSFSDPEVTLSSPNGGETLTGGQITTIKWTSTNAISHDIFIQLNGLMDIPKLIISGLSGDVQQFSWQVPPDLSTTKARIIIVAQGASGRADSDNSDRDITILAGQVIPGHTISTIKVTNKKIVVEGTGFNSTTRLTVNDIGFSSTAILNATATKFTQKGTASNGATIGQLIPSKATVRLVFTNMDGGVTEIIYTRP